MNFPIKAKMGRYPARLNQSHQACALQPEQISSIKLLALSEVGQYLFGLSLGNFLGPIFLSITVLLFESNNHFVKVADLALCTDELFMLFVCRLLSLYKFFVSSIRFSSGLICFFERCNHLVVIHLSKLSILGDFFVEF